MIALSALISFFTFTTGQLIYWLWILFFFGGCFYNLYRSNERNWYKTLLMFYLGSLWTGYILHRPDWAGFCMIAVLSVIPLYIVSSRRPQRDAKICGVLLILLSLSTIIQWIFSVEYVAGHRITWPLYDPNNLAAALNIGLIGSLYYLPAVMPLFAVALIFTGSKAGMIAAFICVIIYLAMKDRRVIYGAVPAFITGIWMFKDILFHSLSTRFPIWETSLQILKDNPLGVGAGQFHINYNPIRTEPISSGYFAHNDVLHMAVEMGVHVAAFFCVIIGLFVFRNFKTAPIHVLCVMCVFLMGMVEFQFYVPCIVILLGIVMADAERIRNGSHTFKPTA